jgi:hypothetical protein
MKKFYFVIVLFLSHSLLQAQPIITYADFNPVIGETFTNNQYTPSSFTPGASGPGVTWDFSSVSPDNTETITMVAPSSTPNAGLFSNATVAADHGGVYEYYNTNNTFMGRVGLDLGGLIFVYSDEEKIISYPMSFNTSMYDNFEAVYAGSVYRSGIVSINCDAYGTLILPSGTINNVLRLHFQENYTDSSASGVNAYTSDNYLWVTPGVHYALCALASNSGTLAMNYIDATVGINDLASAKINFSVYPTCAQSTITIDLKKNHEVKKVSIADVNGNIVYYSDIKSDLQIIDIGELKSGTYSVIIDDGRSIASRPLIKL